MWQAYVYTKKQAKAAAVIPLRFCMFTLYLKSFHPFWNIMPVNDWKNNPQEQKEYFFWNSYTNIMIIF